MGSQDTKVAYLSEELSIPEVPMPKTISVEKPVKKGEFRKDTDEIKWILIDCEMCDNRVIQMPVYRDQIINSKLPVTDVGYVHGDPLHCIVAQLDCDFQVRRRRCCYLTFESDFYTDQ